MRGGEGGRQRGRQAASVFWPGPVGGAGWLRGVTRVLVVAQWAVDKLALCGEGRRPGWSVGVLVFGLAWCCSMAQNKLALCEEVSGARSGCLPGCRGPAWSVLVLVYLLAGLALC